MIAEARFLAERLRELVDAGDAGRGEIVVLLRAFTHVDAYEQALARAGLRPFVVGGRGYWTQQQVEDLIRLLGVVSNPLDDECLFGALASFANGVSPDALWLLRRAARGEDGGNLPRLAGARLALRRGARARARGGAMARARRGRRRRPARALLRDPRAAAQRRRRCLTLEDLVERTMSAFGYDLGLIARRGGVGRMANVRKLMRLARDYEASEGRDLAGFLALAAESTERDEREGMAAVQAEGHDGVRVMTVHAAKGLQFPVVAVPDLGRGLAAGRRHADLVIGPPPAPGEPGPPARRTPSRAAIEAPRSFGMQLAFPAAKSFGLWELTDLNQAESAADAEEGCRLTYVAASRAQDRLILSGAYKPADLAQPEELKPGDSALRRLLPALAASSGWDGASGIVTLPGSRPVDSADRLPDAALEVRISEPSPERAAELVRRFDPPPESDRLTAVTAPPPLVGRRRAPVPVGHLSYSALALYERCGYRFYVERVLGAREAGRGPRNVHRVRGGRSRPGRADRARRPAQPRARCRQRGPRGARVELEARLGAAAGRAAAAPARPRGARRACRGDASCAGAGRRLARLAASRRARLGGDRARAAVRARPRRDRDPRPDRPAGRGRRARCRPWSTTRPTPSRAGRRPSSRTATGPSARSTRWPRATAARGSPTSSSRRPDEPVIEDIGADQLDRVRARLEGIIERMRGGEFEVTADPYPALCFGCPAAARLCPRPRWKPSTS